VSQPLVWARDGRDWPHHGHSRFVKSAGLTWHVQQMGKGPVALLVHGTGASTHSWRVLAPMLARSFTVVMADLPGHGFTQMPTAAGLSLPAMTDGLCRLLDTLNLQPTVAVGHSAGAAVLARAILDKRMHPELLVSINGALLPFASPVGQLFSPLAKLLALNPLVPRVAAWRAANPAAVDRLIRNTGSKLDATGVELYRRLFRSPQHVSGALGMMANWDLTTVVRDLPRLTIPLVLVTGSNDRAIPPDDAATICKLTAKATIQVMPGIGHLAHEEAPAAVADIVVSAARRAALPARKLPAERPRSRLQGAG
jgi:magnesium chelatase accessory protein